MGELIDLPVITTLDLDPEQVLRRAQAAGLQGVVVLGYDRDGKEYIASSYADGGNMLWLLRRAEHRLMKTVDQMAGEAEETP